jgi:hypothetical protein
MMQHHSFCEALQMYNHTQSPSAAISAVEADWWNRNWRLRNLARLYQAPLAPI